VTTNRHVVCWFSHKEEVDKDETVRLTLVTMPKLRAVLATSLVGLDEEIWRDETMVTLRVTRCVAETDSAYGRKE